MVESETLQAIFRMRVACEISKATRAEAQASGREPTPTPAHTHTYTHTLTHARAQTDVFNNYCFSTATMVS
jgi:hypothetical protein